uniref:C-type lectin domain-containing protein n=1 Tax=Caenorhabditis tropicalis TaxID=1561998 RepID=A0A1I7TQ02_9PELO
MISKSLLFLSTLVATACCACFDNGDKEIGGSCYKFVAQQLTFEDARNWCHYQNPVTSSYLAYVPNQFTSNFLASYARSAFGTNDGSFWIGLSRKTGGSWTWDSGNSVTYTNFGDQLGSNYVAESIVNAKWNTFGNNDKNFFVCGYDPAAPPTFAPLSPTPSGATGTTLPTTSPVPTTTGKLDL